MRGILDLSVLQLASAYLFVLIVIFILQRRGIDRKREVLVASIRMTVQLVLVGLLLGRVFQHPHPAVTIVIIAVMEVFAIYTIFRKFKGRMPRAFQRALVFSFLGGSLVALLYFLLVVIRIDPWYDPQYFIPLSGMLTGNAMTGISLAIKTLLDGLTTNRALVEESLVLGATPERAVKPIADSAFEASILPTINSMLGMGIVFLPGMMTGQILSGTDPTTAITYQIAVMLGIFGSVSLTTVLLLRFGVPTFFNAQDQWADDE